MEIQSLIQSYASLFEPPTESPPSRACNHAIPLVPGAKPVVSRPYRYPPKLKDELEKHVQDMLQQGLIQPSASPYSSHVLLVPQKDGTYRFVWIFDNSTPLLLSPSFLVS